MKENTTTPQGDSLDDKKAIAQKLRVNPRTVENMMVRGEIPYLKIGRLVRFRTADVLAALNERCRVN